jgi:membrane associated rhomboid family serine protease
MQMKRLWKPVAALLVAFVLATLFLGLTDLDAVQGAAVAFVMAIVAATIVAGWQRRR